MTYVPAKFEVATAKGQGDDAFTKNTLFDIDLGVKVTQNVAQYPRHHVTLVHQQSLILLHPTVKEKMHLQIKYTIRNVAQCPLHHVTFAPTEIQVTSSKALGREEFTRKFNI